MTKIILFFIFAFSTFAVARSNDPTRPDSSKAVSAEESLRVVEKKGSKLTAARTDSSKAAEAAESLRVVTDGISKKMIASTNYSRMVARADSSKAAEKAESLRVIARADSTVGAAL